MQYIELSPVAAFLLHVNISTAPAGLVNIIPVVAVMIFTRSRNAATGDNSMYCMIPDPFPSVAFGKGSSKRNYIESTAVLSDKVFHGRQKLTSAKN